MLDIKALRAMQPRLEEMARQEMKENFQAEIINFVRTDLFKRNFLETKTKKKTKQSSRVLNNWEKEGLIDKENADEAKWRRYNRVESVWLDIISDLRDFGFSIEKIKGVKGSLFKSTVKRFTPLEYALMYSVIKEPMVLIVYMNGKIKLLSKTLYSKEVLNVNATPHIYFDLLIYVAKEFPNYHFNIQQNIVNEELTEQELAILYFIRTGDYDSIRVRMKDGEIYFMEATSEIPTNSKVIDVINKKSYQNIEIKTHEGKIVSFVSTEKIKLSK